MWPVARMRAGLRTLPSVRIPAVRVASLVRLSAILWALSCARETGDPCDGARQKIGSCSLQPPRRVQGQFPFPTTFAPECAGSDACYAGCINASSCQAIAFVVNLPVTDPNEHIPDDAPEFYQCLTTCWDLL